MGAVDVVVQVEAPPSVASGLQRVGRAGHQVGATSRGVFFPNHRGDLIESAVVVERMRQGAIEEVAELRNPLDVLAQQIVAVGRDRGDQGRRAVRAGPAGQQLPRAAAQRVRGRAGHAQRSLPQRGLRRAAAAAGLAARHRAAHRPTGGAAAGGDLRRDHPRPRPVRGLPGRRGQCQRVGTRRAAGSASWTRRWSTRPGSATSSPWAPPAGGWSRSPTTRCWSPPPRAVRAGCPSGRATRRPARSSSAGPSARFVREVGAMRPEQATARLREAGLDEFAARNLVTYLAEQQAATGRAAHRPDGGLRAVPRRARRLAGLRALRRSAPAC